PANPTPDLGQVEATNPCGEQPLLPNEACNLGSLNVSKFARPGDDSELAIDWDEMERVVRLAGRFLDDVIELNPYPLPEIASTVTTIAPTGTISMIAGCSSGIEPIFALAFQHRVKQPDGERVLTFVNETFEAIAKARGFYSDALKEEIARRGSLHGIPGLPENAANVFKTSHDIPFEWHVRHQAAFQRYTDNGVSKTINLPNDASEEDV